jgi:hypothetical protein
MCSCMSRSSKLELVQQRPCAGGLECSVHDPRLNWKQPPSDKNLSLSSILKTAMCLDVLEDYGE